MSYDDDDIVRVEVDPNTGEEIIPKRGKKKPKVAKKKKGITEGALDPKTPLQIKLFEVSNAPGFQDTDERAVWRRLEDRIDSTDAGRVQEAWLEHCIQWGIDKNRDKPRWRKMPYTAVIAYALNERKEQVWKQANWDRIVQKPTVGEMKEVLAKAEAMAAAYALDDED